MRINKSEWWTYAQAGVTEKIYEASKNYDHTMIHLSILTGIDTAILAKLSNADETRQFSASYSSVQGIAHSLLKTSVNDMLFTDIKDGSYIIEEAPRSIPLPKTFEFLACELNAIEDEEEFDTTINDILDYATQQHEEYMSSPDSFDVELTPPSLDLLRERWAEYRSEINARPDLLRSDIIGRTPYSLFSNIEGIIPTMDETIPKRNNAMIKGYKVCCMGILTQIALDYFCVFDYTYKTILTYKDRDNNIQTLDNDKIRQLISLCLRVDQSYREKIVGYAATKVCKMPT